MKNFSRFFLATATVSMMTLISLTACDNDNTNQSQTQNSSNKIFGAFTVLDDQMTVLMNNEINSDSLKNFNAMYTAYPNINIINMQTVPGSSDDEVNLELAKRVHDLNIATHIIDNGEIASGGVDLFLAGVKRTRGINTKIGVHSWSDGKNQASSFPVGHANHLPYITFYQSIGMSKKDAENFYYFTINSAPAESIHWMTNEEIEKYNILTK